MSAHIKFWPYMSQRSYADICADSAHCNVRLDPHRSCPAAHEGRLHACLACHWVAGKEVQVGHVEEDRVHSRHPASTGLLTGKGQPSIGPSSSCIKDHILGQDERRATFPGPTWPSGTACTAQRGCTRLKLKGPRRLPRKQP